MLELKTIDPSWTLFLDRDGVINREKYLDYVYHFNEFKFYDGVLEALNILGSRFGRVIIATNQRGVEKKLMTEEDLKVLHTHMRQSIEANGGRIDAIYYSTSLDDSHPNRKPQPGMAFLAKETYPEIDFSKSIMVGNNLSDMEFGRNAGMFTVFVLTTSPDISLPHPSVDLAYKDLPAFAAAINNLS